MRSRSPFSTRSIASLAGAVLLMHCGSPVPLRIGIVLDPDGQQGAALAAADVNAAGGIHGRPLELRMLRTLTASTAATMALATADTLVADRAVLAVVGHTNSSASLAGAQVYNEHHVVQIAPTTTTPLYSEAGPYSFRLVASDVHQGAFLARLVLAQPSERVAVLYVNDDYGRALNGALLSELAAHRTAPVYDSPFGEGKAFTDAAGLAHAVARSQPRVLLWLGRSPELAELLPILRPLVPGIRVIASDGFAGVAAETGQISPLVGVRYVRLLDLAAPTEATRRFRERYRERWNAPATDQAALAYEAVQVLAAAISEMGPDRAGIRKYLSQLGSARPGLEVLAGPVTFDAHGDPPPVYFLAEVTAAGSRAIEAGAP